MEDREILMSLCAGACLADHMGDMADDIFEALDQIGIEIPSEVDDLDALGQWLGLEYGCKTLRGTSLISDSSD